MKIYLIKTDDYNMVAITDGQSVKLFDGAPDGRYEGIDIYDDDAVEALREHFEKMNADGCLNGFNDIYSKNEIEYRDSLINSEWTLITEVEG